MPLKARIYVGLVSGLGLMTLGHGVNPWESGNLVRFALCLAVTVIGSGFKVSLPGIQGTMSFYFLFVLISVAQLTLSETMAIVGAAVIWQCYWHAKNRPSVMQIVFNLGSNFVAADLAYLTFHAALWDHLAVGAPLRMAAAAVIFFIANTAPVAAVIALTEGKKIKDLWNGSYLWSFPFYLVCRPLVEY
jgi:hypothetical protein